VEEAAVFVVPDQEGSQKIYAAAIPKTGESLSEADLKNTVSGLVPWYALPQRILILNEFPRTGSGKIDRRRLGLQAQEISL
jgi:acyl-CoA synthetase (AMP-forming)/AMP-acid ligase II